MGHFIKACPDSVSLPILDKEPQEMGLSEYEYAFYTAIANNDSARELMQ